MLLIAFGVGVGVVLGCSTGGLSSPNTELASQAGSPTWPGTCSCPASPSPWPTSPSTRWSCARRAGRAGRGLPDDGPGQGCGTRWWCAATPCPTPAAHHHADLPQPRLRGLGGHHHRDGLLLARARPARLRGVANARLPPPAGVFLLFSAAVIIANLLADLLYHLPRPAREDRLMTQPAIEEPSAGFPRRTPPSPACPRLSPKSIVRARRRRAAGRAWAVPAQQHRHGSGWPSWSCSSPWPCSRRCSSPRASWT